MKKSIAAGSIEPRNPRPPALAEQRGRICKRSGAMYGVIATAVAAKPAVHQSIDRSPLVPRCLVSRNGCRSADQAAAIGHADEPSQWARYKYTICFRFVVTCSVSYSSGGQLRGRL